MRKILFPFICLLLLLAGLRAQAPETPQAFNYQAIARDAFGYPLANHAISLRITILDSVYSGPVLYAETFSTTTNQFGLFNVDIGKGVVISGAFSGISWGRNGKWLQVEMDQNAGNNYVLMGNSQMLSVPYALYAASSGSSFNQNMSTSYSPTGDTMYIGNNFFIVPGLSMANACRNDYADTIPYTYYFPHVGDNPYNIQYGLPKFILKNYIELDSIEAISRFRSGTGHDYSDYFESCRSMKHYFRPKAAVNWANVKEFAPVNGVISNAFPDGVCGTQIWITPLGMPAFLVCIFHVNLNPPLNIGDTIWAGRQIGTHCGSQTTSDIAVQVTETNGGWQRISYFDVMTDKLFACYMAHGIPNRDSLIISKVARDADTLHCNGSVFLNSGTINNWVTVY